MKIAIIGGGAAGFFSAIHVKENYPDVDVILFEKSNKLLAKVKISGGGRCNVTNNCPSISELSKAYPRGGKQLKKLFPQFNITHTMRWFKSRGVPLHTESDNRVFPKTNKSQTIIDCLMNEVSRLNIQIKLKKNIIDLLPVNNGIQLSFADDEKTRVFDKVIIATGGSPKRSGLEWLEKLGHKIVDPVPSLFTFNMPGDSIVDLMGVVAPEAIVRIEGSKLISQGPLLITHWGMSGPTILKLSSFGARLLDEVEYNFNVQVNWTGENNHETVQEEILLIVESNKNKLMINVRPFNLPTRLWSFLLSKIDITQTQTWEHLGKKARNKLVNILTHDIYHVKGKTTFKEEFVTAGGVSLSSIDMRTMQSKVCKNLYFAGEVLDIDAITGGYNFQAAWTTGFVAGKLSG